MKITHSYIKHISIFLSFLLLFQSCRVYQSKTVSLDKAIQSERRVKIKTTFNKTYKFKKLLKEEQQLFGIANKRSRTAKTLFNQIVHKNDNKRFVKILLLQNTIKEIHLQNKDMTDLVSISIVVLSFYAIIIIGAIFGSL